MEYVIYGTAGSAMPMIAEINQYSRDFDTPHANARRIVACVNACAGMPDDMAPGSVVKLADAVAKAIPLIEAKNAALRLLLARASAFKPGQTDFGVWHAAKATDIGEVLNAARAALATE